MTALGKFNYLESPTTDTIPNSIYIFDNGLGFDSHPADWFEPYFSRNITNNTHSKR